MGYFSNQDAINQEERYNRQLNSGDYDRELDGYDKKNLLLQKKYAKEYKVFCQKLGKSKTRNYEPDYHEIHEEENGLGR